MKEEQKRRVAIYSRKSKFTGKGESIENQIELCRQYIRVHFPDCGGDDILIYEDEGFSGGTTVRPQFKKMMAGAKARKFSAVVCYRLDRISRNIGDFTKLIGELEALDIAFISIREQFDTSSPMGRAMMYISSVFSQLERETIAERIRDNMRELAKTGRWLGGTTPTGYASESVESITIEGKVKKAYRLKILPEEAGLIRQIFIEYLETNSLTKTEAFLVSTGCTTKRGNAFTRFALKNILTNPVYMIADRDAYAYFVGNEVDLSTDEIGFDGKHGVMAYNRTIQKPGCAHQIRPMNEWIVSVGGHTGIISGADWICAQRNLEQNRSKAYRKPRSNTALLSGLLFCGKCGGYMRPKLSSRVNEQEERIYGYLCTMKEKSRGCRCNIKNADGNRMDEAVWNEIKKLEEDNGELIRRLEQGRKGILREDNHDGDINRLYKCLEDNEKEIAALISLISKTSDNAAGDYIVERIDQLHEQRKRVKSQVAEMESAASGYMLSDMEADSIRRRLSSFQDMMDGMGIEQKRAALRSFVKKVVWDGESVHIYLIGSEGGASFSG